MKKVLLIASLALAAPVITTSFSSCSVVKTLNTVNQISNIAGTANELSGVLGSTLGLSTGQKSGLTGILSDYITGTNGIAGLAKGNKKNYLSQLGGLNFGTLGKVKNLLTAAQYTKLLGLGSNSGSNPLGLLSNLNGGNNLSGDAKSVLTGLLLNNIR